MSSEQPEDPKPRRRWPLFAAGAVLVAIVIGVGLFVADRYGVRAISLNTAIRTTAVTPARPPLQTEAYFINGLKAQPFDEWWNARSDHKLLAYAVLNCKRLTTLAVDVMPRQLFSALLLDLDPNGNHVFLAKDGDDAALADRDKDAVPLPLTPVDQQLLALSDSIARARLVAADGATSNMPWVQRLGLATVIVSALATLFVTLQGKTRAVELTDQQKETLDAAGPGTRLLHAVSGPGSGFRWVAFLAIVLSITGTALTGLKQVYDPTRILTQNTRALLDLRQLHQEVILSVECQQGAMATVPQKKMTEWTGAIRRIRATVLPEYGAYANLDVGGSSQRQEPANGDSGGTPPRNAAGTTEAGLNQPSAATPGAAQGGTQNTASAPATPPAPAPSSQ